MKNADKFVDKIFSKAQPAPAGTEKAPESAAPANPRQEIFRVLNNRRQRIMRLRSPK